jgi:hypothetical protein
MGELGTPAATRHIAAEYAELCALQLRLMSDGGAPWETVRSEWKLYEILHPEASVSQRTFKRSALLAAALLPPRRFYALRQQVAQNALYQSIRERWLPIPQMRHIQKDWRAKS